MYEVEIQAAGFSTFKQTGINLGVDQKVRVNAALAVGEVTSIITVTSEGTTPQTDASDLNATVSQRAIQSLPNIGRNPLRYATTVPGIVPRSTFNATGLDNIPAGENSRFNVSNFTVNGCSHIIAQVNNLFKSTFPNRLGVKLLCF